MFRHKPTVSLLILHCFLAVGYVTVAAKADVDSLQGKPIAGCSFEDSQCVYHVNLGHHGTCDTTGKDGDTVLMKLVKLQNMLLEQSLLTQAVSMKYDNVTMVIQKIRSALNSLDAVTRHELQPLLQTVISANNATRAELAPVLTRLQTLEKEQGNVLLWLNRIENERAQLLLKVDASSKVYSSCSEWKRNGHHQDGHYLLDVDGKGGVQAFYVWCNMTSSPPTASIGHDRGLRTKTVGYEKVGSHICKVLYDVTMRQLTALMSNSSNCKQYFKYECHGALINTGGSGGQSTWWVSRDGENMTYLPGGDPKLGGCACKRTNTCAGGHECNCDMNDLTWRQDEGYITDVSKLPVTELRFGDTGNAGEQAYFTLGPVECEN
ncbi:contactin-associated protein-like 2 [Lingula anatina]|uniref:Contactin-associated protein-like 2 n=1 Tax=Lingula anatina TaxID=7574 RepID=A0A1S3JDW6_LINAN|nr:contactin-associated protein-like 2 [Lingula anatina]|eukprot:XP_013408079.1 contactin-associated protein-like 2 [Lingula anatina]